MPSGFLKNLVVPSRSKQWAGLACAVTLCFGSMGLPLAQADAVSNLPSLGDGAGGDLSVRDEKRLGELIMRDYRALGAVTNDPEITGYLNVLGGQIVQAAGENPADFEFFLVADPSINAFALPGGYIGVHTGLLAASRTEGELASVLAHEVGHVTQRHIARLYGQQKNTNLVSAAAMIAALLVASSNPQAASGIAAAGAGFQIDRQLAFTRDAEREADRVGYSTLVNAGYDPEGMVSFFGRLQQSSRLYENNAPKYLRTHPLTTERIADIQNRAGLEKLKLQPTVPASLEFELLRMRALIYADRGPQRLRERMESLEASQALEQLGYTNPVALVFGQALVHEKMNQLEQSLDAAERALDMERIQSQTIVDNSDQPAPLLLASQAMEMRLKLRAGLNGGPEAMAQVRTRDELNESDQVLLGELEQYLDTYRSSYSVKVQYVQGLQSMGLYALSADYLRDLRVIYRSRPEVFDLSAKAMLAENNRAKYHLFLSQAYAARGAYRPAIEQTRLARRHAANNYYLTSEIEAMEQRYKNRVDEEQRMAESFR